MRVCLIADDTSIIENIWASATSLTPGSSLSGDSPNITGNCRNGKRNSRLLCVLPAPIIIQSICLHETHRSAASSLASDRRMGEQKTADVASRSHYWCFQTSAAASVVWSWPISDVRATQLMLGIKFFLLSAQLAATSLSLSLSLSLSPRLDVWSGIGK